jgi:uncharacterized protein (DUF169 family)
MVMGFEMPNDVQAELATLVGVMVEGGYLGADEAPRIPTLPHKSAGVVYGPLQDFPVEPDAIVLWLTPRQAMLLSEASSACRWTGSTPAVTLGRPACAAIPTAVSRGVTTTSLGCIGMRTYTEIADDHLLAVIPARAMSQLEEALTEIVEANRTMADFHAARKAGAVLAAPERRSRRRAT